MLLDSDQITPLIDVKRKLEKQIEEALNKVALLRKRHDAISTSIDILRSNDSELESMVIPASLKVNGKGHGRVYMDHQKVEDYVLVILADGPKSKKDIMTSLNNNTIEFNQSGLLSILTTSPKITRIGERDQTRYKLTGK